MKNISVILETLLAPGGIIVGLIVLLSVNSWFFKRIKKTDANGGISKGIIAAFIVLVAIFAFVLSLSIEKSVKEQIISFLGIVLSAAIALSSTTVLGNLIAGIMNNSMERFRNGDLILLEKIKGRVTKKGLFHVEIQLEDSNFMTIPNLYIAQHPVKLTRQTMTVISSSVSLGYDVSRGRIEEVLKEAALNAGLKDPYVFIMELGDFSVVYKIHGFLEDSSTYFSTSSLLNAKVMDALHSSDIEIVSPAFMNQRRVDDKVFLFKEKIADFEKDNNGEVPEEKVFDEAIKSAKTERKKDFLIKLQKNDEELKKTLKETEDKEKQTNIKSMIERNKRRMQRLEESIKADRKAEDEN